MRVTFPHMGRVYIPLKTLFESLGLDVIIPPANNSAIKDMGCRYSPEYSCMPFKLILGNILYALEKGADTLVMLGGSGPCRFGYFGHLLNLIARDMGYRFNFICLEPSTLLRDISRFKQIAGCGYKDITLSLLLGWKKLQAVDFLETVYWKTLPYATRKEKVRDVFPGIVASIESCSSFSQIEEIQVEGFSALNGLKDRFAPLPRVAVVGDIYTLNEPYANHNIEMLLCDMNIEPCRSIFTSTWVRNNLLPWERKKINAEMAKLARGYLNDSIGGFALETIYHSIRCAGRGFDGILHIFPVTCMPEIVSRQILHKVAGEKNIPIMSITIDEHNDKTGFETRLEAFSEILHDNKSVNSRNP